MDAPSDWCIVLTDIKGSTKAIENGRYKDVNMVGAACIAACINNCKQEIPFVFGGDGATILIPAKYKSVIEQQLSAVSKFSQKYYDLSLRIGIMPVSEIYARGHEFKVCKYQLSTGASIYMYGGDGPMATDDIIKSGEFLIPDNDRAGDPDLTGLSCRWQPVKSGRGVILSILVNAKKQKNQNEIYRQVNTFIENSIADNPNPIANDQGLKYTWPGIKTLQRSRIVWGQKSPLKNICNQVFETLVFRICSALNITAGSFEPQQYKNDMITNSDYRKFDGMLRMVVDCTDAQTQHIETYLDELYQDGQINYGVHKSKATLLTCFVQSLDGKGHIHFVDGDDGGYALAARNLKKQFNAA